MSVNSLSGTLEPVALALGNHLWQSTLFFALIAVLTFVLRKNHARLRYWLWFAASMKFLIPFALLIAVGGHLSILSHSFPRSHSEESTRSIAAVELMGQPFTDQKIPSVNYARNLTDGAAWGTSIAVRSADFLRQVPWLSSVVILIWLGGLLVVLGKWTVQWCRISNAVSQTFAMQQGRELEMLRRMEDQAGLRQRIHLRSLSASIEPGIFGLFQPVLLWPKGISQRLDDAQLEAILAHEVYHVRRADNITAAIHMMVEALFWFHPIVWLLETRLMTERERACDEEVVALCGRPETYAEGILRICEFSMKSPVACVSGVTGADLKRRVAEIMANRIGRRLDFSKKLLLLVVGLTAVVVPIMLGLISTPFFALAEEGQALTDGWVAAAGGKQEFEVASVRQDKSDRNAGANFTLGPGNAYATTGGRFSGVNLPLIDYIRFAYKLTDNQTELLQSGAPKWISIDRFDIEARSESRDPSKDQMRLMIQSLLANRFNMKVHTETRELPVIAMVLAKAGKLGPQLRLHSANDPSCSTLIPRAGTDTFPAVPSAVDGMLPVACGDIMNAGVASAPSHVRLGGRNVSLTLLAAHLSQMANLSRPVLDRTGLKGTYDFVLEWGPDPTPGETGAVAPGDPGTILQEALQDQLGIKLERQNGPVDILVIDHIDQPSEN